MDFWMIVLAIALGVTIGPFVLYMLLSVIAVAVGFIGAGVLWIFSLFHK